MDTTWDNAGQRGTTRDNAGQRGTTRDNAGQRGTTRDNAGQRGTTRDNAGQRGTTRDNAGQRGTTRDNAGQRGTTRDNAGQRGTTRDNAGQRGTTRDNAGQRGTTWAHASVGDRVVVDTETNQDSISKDPYCCAIKMNELVVGHIPREISRHVYFFITSEGGVVKGHALSTTYQPSTIPSGGLEIPLLTFSCSRFVTFQKMKEFVTTLYNYEYSGNTSANRSNDDEDEEDDRI